MLLVRSACLVACTFTALLTTSLARARGRVKLLVVEDTSGVAVLAPELEQRDHLDKTH